jgi:hypothetical protein
MAKRKTKAKAEETIVETIEVVENEPTIKDVIEDVVEIVEDVKEDLTEIIEDTTEMVEDVIEDVTNVVEKIIDIFDGDDSQRTKDIKSAIAMVKPKNIAATPIIFNKFKTITNEKYNKKAVFAEIKQLLKKK